MYRVSEEQLLPLRKDNPLAGWFAIMIDSTDLGLAKWLVPSYVKEGILSYWGSLSISISKYWILWEGFKTDF